MFEEHQMRGILPAALSTCIALFAWPAAVLAQYPERPVTLIVPYAAGGPTDLAARNLASHAGSVLAQKIIVVNRPGAQGALGSQQVRTAPPDGYTLLIARVGSHAALPAIDPATPYKWNDFSFLS